MNDDFNLEKLIGLSETIDKAVDEYFEKQKIKDETKKSENVGVKNYTLEDLKQSLINKLNNYVGKLCNLEKEIELLKIILDYETKN